MAPSAVDGGPQARTRGDLVHHSPCSLAHVVLRTNPESYKEMISFYTNLLKARVIHEDPVLAFLRYDDEHHRVAIFAIPGLQLPNVDSKLVGVDHMAFSYPTLTGLAQQYVYLKSLEKPVLPVWSVNHGPTTSLYYRDPNGNKIELQVDNFDDPQEADAFMSGPKYDINPIGTDFDPEAWSAGLLAMVDADGNEGLSPEDLKMRKTRTEIGERHNLPAGF
jgi:catechol-2,3-dioxygenase